MYNWVLIEPNGEGNQYFSGYEAMELCRRVHWEYLPDPSAYVGAMPVTTANVQVYAVFGVTPEGRLLDTGYKLDGRREKWSQL